MSQKPKKTLSKKKKHPNGNGNAPYGREEIKEAVFDVTEKLLSKYSPNEITVRQIAKLAGINHALIHRHFGTKKDLILAVHAREIEKIDRVASQVENIEESAETFFRALEKNKFRRLALARAMIDEVDPRLIQNHFPVMRHLVELLQKKQNKSEAENKHRAEILAMVLAAASLGWFLYEPFLLASTETDEQNKDAVRQKVVEILNEFIEKI